MYPLCGRVVLSAGVAGPSAFNALVKAREAAAIVDAIIILLVVLIVLPFVCFRFQSHDCAGTVYFPLRLLAADDGASSYFLTSLSALWMPKEFDLGFLAGRLPANFITVQIAKYMQNARSREWPIWPRLSRAVRSWLSAGLLLVALCFSQRALAGVTLDELRAEPNLTPERFIKHFADFKFALGRDVQKPETFLKSQAGDCDDFATLAADVLRERGYTTRLVAVFMPNDVHVVCYVKETNSYLDYNCRKQTSPLVKCDQELAAIAASVAASFRTQWRTVSEYTFQDGVRKFVSTEFR